MWDRGKSVAAACDTKHVYEKERETESVCVPYL